MPSASSYTNKLRALTDSRNSKVQYPGNVVNTYRPALSLTCDSNMVPSVVTIAGTRDTNSYTGDGSLATQATLNSPQALCTDSIGNVFIADRDNRCVRKIDTAGKISTLNLGIVFATESGGFNGPIGIAIDKNDKLYISDTWADRIVTWANGTVGYITPPATGINVSYLSDPYSLWITNNNLYVANYIGYVSYDITNGAHTGTISVFDITAGTWKPYDDFYKSGDAGNNIRNFAYPKYASVGPDGSVYIVRQPNAITTAFTHCVRRYKNGVYSTFAGISGTTNGPDEDIGDGGPATAAKLKAPASVFPDAFGNVYICDTGNGRIRMVTPDGIIQTVVGGGSSYNEGGSPLEIQASPVSMWFDAQGRMYFTNTDGTIRRIISVYKPSWWNPVRYEKICKPCNAIVRPPPPTTLTAFVATGSVFSSAGFYVAYVGGKWVAVGAFSTILHSIDGTNWQAATGSLITNIGYSVAYGNGIWVAVGDSNSVRSTDGTVWTDVAAGLTQRRVVVYGNGRFIAGGGTGVGSISYSTDGNTWTNVSNGLFGSVISIAHSGGNNWLAVSDNPGGGDLVVAYSTDNGGTWINATTPVLTGQLISMAYGGGKWVAVGTDSSGNSIIHSSDRITWQNATGTFPTTVRSVAYGGSKWVAVANSSILHSTNGITWQPATGIIPTNINSLAYGDGIWVAVGYETGMVYSIDGGSSWQVLNSGITYNSAGAPYVAYGNGRWVVVGANIAYVTQS